METSLNSSLSLWHQNRFGTSQSLFFLDSHTHAVLNSHCPTKQQKKKELGLCANEWNYRMAKRDITYQEHVARVREEMKKATDSEIMSSQLRVQQKANE